MAKIEQLKKEVELLPPGDFQLFEEWFNEFKARIGQTTLAKKQSGTKFLLGIAGMFDSDLNHTSENVHELVADAILKKYEKKIMTALVDSGFLYATLLAFRFK